VYAAPLSDIFTSAGTLTLGQVTPGLSAGISTGTFTGLIDEVRVWSRTHNPSVIKDNFRVTATKTTTDISHVWNFNEGIGLTAYEKVSATNMMPVSTSNPPVWVKSSLDLSVKGSLDIPRMTATDEQNADLIAAAQAACEGLISSFSLNTIDSDLDTLLAVYQALCMQEMITAGNEDQAAATLASLADQYMAATNDSNNPLVTECAFSSIAAFVGATIDSGSCTVCKFPRKDVSDGCVCLDTHSGAGCDVACPTTDDQPPCSSNGVCFSGVCSCHPRHYASGSTAETFWKNYVDEVNPSTTSGYACEACSDGWVGKHCQFAKVTPESKVSAMAYGSYITTVEGVSFVHSIPGTYSLLKTDSVEVQALFVPCEGDNTCRKMTELAMSASTSSVHIQHSPDGGNLTVLVKEGGAITETLTFPETKTFGGITVRWTDDPFIEIVSGGSSFVTYDSELGLVTNAMISSSHASTNTGLLGKSGGNWLTDMTCGSTGVTEDTVTLNHVGDCVRTTFKAATSFIHDDLGSEDLTSAGFALELTGGAQLTTDTLDVDQAVTEVTFGVWVKYTSTSTSVPLMTLNLATSNIVLRVNLGKLVLDWGSTYTTDLTLTQDSWHFLVWSWRSDTGKSAMYLINEDTVQAEDPIDATVRQGESLSLQSITFSAVGSTTLSLDCVRAWKATLSVDTAYTARQHYCSTTKDATKLMLSAGFDEGTGTTSTVNTYRPATGAVYGSVARNATATISGIDINNKYFIMKVISFTNIRKT